MDFHYDVALGRKLLSDGLGAGVISTCFGGLAFVAIDVTEELEREGLLAG